MDGDVARLRAKGVTITLADGSEVALRYDNWALIEVEEFAGGFDGIQKFIADPKTKWRRLSRLVGFGLLHLYSEIEEPSERQLARLLDPARMAEYGVAFDVAIVQAMTLPGEGNGEGEPGPFLGGGSSTSPPSGLVSVSASSGA